MNQRFQFFCRLFLIWIVVNTLLRLVLFLDAGFQPSVPLTMQIFLSGLINDLPPFFLITLPLSLALCLIPSPKSKKGQHILPIVACIFFVVYSIAFVFQSCSEWFFWQEFFSRFNFIAVDYLVYTHEVLGNIYESYPVIKIFALIFLIGGIVSFVALRSLRGKESWRPRVKYSLPILAVIVCVSIFFAPLTAGNDRLSHELSRNGLWELASAFRNNKLDFENFYTTLPEDQALENIRSQVSEPTATFADQTTLLRHVVNGNSEKRLNVIQIVVESLSFKYLTPERMPYLSDLLPKSLFFSNIRATGTRTVRGIEALTLSVPPTPGASLVRQPKATNLFTIGSVFRDRGYETSFIYGGFGYFDNMNAFFAGNGFQVVDRASIDQKTFANVWGVCDEDLLKTVLQEADKTYAQGKPFYHFVLTTSNHRPFTYPDGKVSIPSGTGRSGAVAYTDYAIGQFLKEAATKPWFQDTIFIIIADHSAGSAGYTDLPPDRYHIPCLFYSPAHIPPKTVDVLCSQIDIPPTLFALMGWDYDSLFFGRNAFGIHAEEGRAWIGTYQLLGYLENDGLAILEPHKTAQVEGAANAELKETLIKKAIAGYQSASHLIEQQQK